MAIAYVAKNKIVNDSATSSTVVPMPTGIAAGQLLIVFIASVASNPDVATPSGWTRIAQYGPASTLKSVAYRRVATGGDAGASYTWNWTSSGRNLGFSVAYSGVDTAAAIGFDYYATRDAPNGPLPSPPMAMSNGDWLVTAGFGRENPGSDTVKNWSINDPDGDQRHDEYTPNLGTGIKTTGCYFDTARPLAAGSASRILTVTPAMQQTHVWSLRIPAPAGSEAPAGNPWSHMGQPIR